MVQMQIELNISALFLHLESVNKTTMITKYHSSHELNNIL